MSRAFARLSEITGAPVAHHIRSALTAHLNEVGLLLDSDEPNPEPSRRRVYTTKKETK